MAPITVRASIIVAAAGGWSAMFRAYLMVHLFGPGGISTSGCPVVVHGKTFLIWAKLEMIVADGEGVRQLNGKGRQV